MLNGKRRNIGLIGLRKVGKTSIIWEFMRQNHHFVQDYIYVKEKPTKTMFRKMLGSVLYTCMEHSDAQTKHMWMATDKNLKELAMEWAQADPVIAKLSFEIRDAINDDAEPEELLGLTLMGRQHP
jgi:GTPase SAR1 family protein